MAYRWNANLIKLSTALLLLTILILSGFSRGSVQAGALAQATSAATVSTTMAEPGDKIGDMMLTALKSADLLTSGLPELANYCAYHSLPVDNTYHPGTVSAWCVLKPLDAVVVGPSWFVYDKALLNKNWSALSYQLSVDGQAIDLKPFGTVELLTRNGVGVRRIWGVVLNRLSVGQHIIHQTWTQKQAINDGKYNNEPGTYDFIYTVIVHECPLQLSGTLAAPTASATMVATAAKANINFRPADFGITAGEIDECGARIFEVAPGSIADKAKLLGDDVVVAVNGTPLTGRLQALTLLSAALASKSAVTLTVERRGSFADLTWQPAMK